MTPASCLSSESRSFSKTSLSWIINKHKTLYSSFIFSRMFKEVDAEISSSTYCLYWSPLTQRMHGRMYACLWFCCVGKTQSKASSKGHFVHRKSHEQEKKILRYASFKVGQLPRSNTVTLDSKQQNKEKIIPDSDKYCGSGGQHENIQHKALLQTLDEQFQFQLFNQP